MNYEQNYSGAKLHNIRISFSLDVMQKRPISYFLKNAKILQNRSFLKKWTNPGLVHFRSFQTNISMLTTNQGEKNVKSIQFMALGFKTMTFLTWVVSHDQTRATALKIFISKYIWQNLKDSLERLTLFPKKSKKLKEIFFTVKGDTLQGCYKMMRQ